MKKLAISLIVILGLAGLVMANMDDLLSFALVSQATTKLKSHEDIVLDAGNEWYDDYFTVSYIDSETIAIGEPRYWQQNTNFILLGNDRALLFDSGSGVRDIKPVVDALTAFPLVVLCSHTHYDHIGNHGKFENVVLAKTQIDFVEPRDSAAHRMAVKEGSLSGPSRSAESVEDGAEIDLGGRILKIVYTPGHSADSIMILDAERQQLFAGDFIYSFVAARGPMIYSSDIDDYLASVRKLISTTGPDIKIYGSHNPDTNLIVYVRRDLLDMEAFFEGRTSGPIPSFGRINDRIVAIY